jgi:hypothetical protein
MVLRRELAAQKGLEFQRLVGRSIVAGKGGGGERPLERRGFGIASGRGNGAVQARDVDDPSVSDLAAGGGSEGMGVVAGGVVSEGFG